MLPLVCLRHSIRNFESASVIPPSDLAPFLASPVAALSDLVVFFDSDMFGLAQL